MKDSTQGQTQVLIVNIRVNCHSFPGNNLAYFVWAVMTIKNVL
jgi:hypothetical protein